MAELLNRYQANTSVIFQLIL